MNVYSEHPNVLSYALIALETTPVTAYLDMFWLKMNVHATVSRMKFDELNKTE